MKHLEEDEQKALFQWAAYFPCLKWMYAVPNGVFLHGDKLTRAKQAARLKAQGMKPGVSDICLPMVTDKYPGLYIEMKRSKGAYKVSEAQKDFMKYAEEQGYKVAVCRGTREAIEVITEYANL